MWAEDIVDGFWWFGVVLVDDSSAKPILEVLSISKEFKNVDCPKGSLANFFFVCCCNWCLVGALNDNKGFSLRGRPGPRFEFALFKGLLSSAKGNIGSLPKRVANVAVLVKKLLVDDNEGDCGSVLLRLGVLLHCLSMILMLFVCIRSSFSKDDGDGDPASPNSDVGAIYKYFVKSRYNKYNNDFVSWIIYKCMHRCKCAYVMFMNYYLLNI